MIKHKFNKTLQTVTHETVFGHLHNKIKLWSKTWKNWNEFEGEKPKYVFHGKTE